MRPRHAAAALGLIALVAGAIVAGAALWQTSVPDGLRLPELDAAREFAGPAREEAEDFEAFLRVTFLVSQVVLIGVLVAYARRGARLAQQSAAGPIGTGFLLGMLGIGLVWLAQLPFRALELWWARRHDVVDVGWLEWLFGDWLALAGQFLFLCVALLIVMGLARLLRRTWWLPAAVAFVGLATLFTFVSPYLMAPELREPRGPQLRAEAAQIARAEGVEDVPLQIEEVREVTDAPNAYATGLGPSRTVVLWDTIVDFPRREVKVVVAHEYAHIARDHLPKSLGWLALLVLPTVLVMAVATRRRGGPGRPEAVPVVLLVFVLVSLAMTPLQSAASRRYEAEADWAALQVTRDPEAMRGLFRRFTTVGLADPDPPGWYHALFDSHPSGLERVAMARAWERSRR